MTENGKRQTTPPRRPTTPPRRNSIPPKAAPEHPSVRQDVVPAIRKTLGGEAGKAIVEGLQLLENNLNDITRGLETDTNERIRNLRSETATATRVSGEASKHVNELTDSVRSASLAAGAAQKDAENAQRLAEKAATKDEYNTLKGRVDETEKGLNGIKHELKVVAEAMTHEVSVVGAEGQSEKRKKKGGELIAHLVAEVEGQKAELGTYGDKLDEAVKTADQASRNAEEAKDLLENANKLMQETQDVANEGTNGVTEKVEKAVADVKASIAEAFGNIDGKLQLIAQLALGNDYEGEVQTEIERPSFEDKEKR